MTCVARKRVQIFHALKTAMFHQPSTKHACKVRYANSEHSLSI